MKDYLTTKEKKDIELEGIARHRLSNKEYKKLEQEEKKELKRQEKGK